MPELVVSRMAKTLRRNNILIDWSQNNGKKTTIAPYSMRGREHPTVAAPRTWDEIARPDRTWTTGRYSTASIAAWTRWPPS